MKAEAEGSSFILHPSAFILSSRMRPPEGAKSMANIQRVGVLGCGLMGSGIAQTAAQAGYETVVREVEQKFLDKGLGGIQKSLAKFVEKGKLSAEDRNACIGRRKGTTSLDDLADCDG